MCDRNRKLKTLETLNRRHKQKKATNACFNTKKETQNTLISLSFGSFRTVLLKILSQNFTHFHGKFDILNCGTRKVLLFSNHAGGISLFPQVGHEADPATQLPREEVTGPVTLLSCQSGLEKSKTFPVPQFKNLKLSVKVRKISRQNFR